MKYIIASLLALTSFVYCCSQSYEKFIIDLKNKELETKTSIPFSVIKILDSRYDQSNIGCIVKHLNFKGISEGRMEAIFPDSLKTYLPEALNNVLQLDRSSPDTLVILIKTFRLVDYIVDEVVNKYDPKLLLNLSASFYNLNSNNYRKIFSIDDILDQRLNRSKYIDRKNIADLRANALVEVLSVIFKNKKWRPSGLAFSKMEVEQGLKKRFDLPILTEKVIHAGLFKTFAEFKNNKPSVTHIKAVYKKNTLIELRDSVNEKIDLLKYWGAADGNKNYIVFRGDLCELITSDRSFKFKSYREKDDLKGNPTYGDYATEYGLLPSAIMKMSQQGALPENFYLNMDTGEVHLEELFGKSGLTSFQKELLK